MDREALEREITVRLFQTSNALQAFLDKMLKDNKITAKQFFMMIIIGSFGYEPKISEIASRFGTSHQNVKQVLLKLEREKYLDLYKDKTDSRITRTRFTKKANEFWANRNDGDEETMNRLFSPLGINEMQIFKDSLLKTLDSIEELNKLFMK